MSTIKQDRKDLEALLNGIDPLQQPAVSNQQTQPNLIQPAAPSVVDNTSGDNLSTEKLFDFDPTATRKVLRKKARKTVYSIAKHILTDEQLEEEYVQDKIDQDIETLTDLYMQNESNRVMQESLVNSVSRGNTMPRMYEVFAQLTDKIQAINKQIQTTEQQIRKTYIDLKLEIKDKEAEMMETSPQKAIEGPQMQKDSIVVTSSKQQIDILEQRHRENMKRLEEAKQTEYKEG